MATLRELIEDAEQRVRVYINPSIGDCHEALDKILQAAGLGGITHDRIIYLDIDNERVRIETEWSVHGIDIPSKPKFPVSLEFEIPVSIIDAADPILAAKKWGHEKKLKQLRVEVQRAKNVLNSAERALNKAIAEGP